MSLGHTVVSREEWIAARTQFLAKEKAFTRLRDELSQARRDLPWERVEKQYVFEGPQGKETLQDRFEGRSQLIVCHFMFGPDWDAVAMMLPSVAPPILMVASLTRDHADPVRGLLAGIRFTSLPGRLRGPHGAVVRRRSDERFVDRRPRDLGVC